MTSGSSLSLPPLPLFCHYNHLDHIDNIDKDPKVGLIFYNALSHDKNNFIEGQGDRVSTLLICVSAKCSIAPVMMLASPQKITWVGRDTTASALDATKCGHRSKRKIIDDLRDAWQLWRDTYRRSLVINPIHNLPFPPVL